MSEQQIDELGPQEPASTEAPAEAAVSAAEQIAAPSPETAAPATADDLDTLLAQFDAEVGPIAGPLGQEAPPEPQPVADPLDQPASPAEIDAARELVAIRPAQRLTGDGDRVRDYSKEVQARLPAFLPDNYAEDAMVAEALRNPELEIAWLSRNVDPRQARLELGRVNQTLAQLRASPFAPPEQVAQLTEWSRNLT